ncbi:MAG: nucleotidyl transferase AbiEii/AbiGii toxin family protein [Patescibacteria group bacterium]|nr:nucleotidyl transferase AbiEii/AbiGii toxin family protein [Patescibacteria group bacterium]
MIAREEIYQKASEGGVDPNIIEKDYHLGIALKMISKNPKIKNWIFRGGTALKKCYFNDYRFSEDLDFTLTDRAIKNEKEIKEILEKICEQANQEFGTALNFFKIVKEREKYGEEAFKAMLHFQSVKGISKIKIDLSFADKIFIKPIKRNIFHLYSDDFIFGKPNINTVKLEEIIVDKLMAISFIRTYPRNRDLFDIWHILKNKKLDLKLVKEIFNKKCDYREIDKKLIFQINQKHLSQFKQYWQAQLASLVKDLPDFEMITKAIVADIKRIFNDRDK